MKPNPKFLSQPPEFWANIRLISQKLKYTDTKTKKIKTHTVDDIVQAYEVEKLSAEKLIEDGRPTVFGQLLVDYFAYRADILNGQVEANLMSLNDARTLFQQLKEKYKPTCPLPLNKQSGDKKGPAYFTCIINTLIEAHCSRYAVNYDPRLLTSFTQNGLPIRTLARRVDGAFPDTINPLAIWEIKEYYYTKTFGSRVADGVYETLLDGLELQDVRKELGVTTKHYLFIDDHFTWWDCGRSYLCRICDLLHMGLVTEVIVGREVVSALPGIVDEWVADAKQLGVAPRQLLH